MSQEDEKASANPIMVMVDERTSEKYARVVGHKRHGQGPKHEVAHQRHVELKVWGHTGGTAGNIILKSDGEPACVAVRDAPAKYHGGIVVQEGPAAGESQSNGLVEEAGKTVEFVRVLIQWMIRWAAMMVSRYMVGKDGRTSYERRRGRACRAPVATFGENVWYKQIRLDKIESEWHEGLWLGQSRSTNETTVETAEGVVRAYAARRQDVAER